MARRTARLLPLETELIACAVELARDGAPEFHGFAIAKQIRDRTGARSLTAHGTLYKALGRLERSTFLESRWEEPEAAAAAARPRRRLYRVTENGERELARIQADRQLSPLPRPRTATS